MSDSQSTFPFSADVQFDSILPKPERRLRVVRRVVDPGMFYRDHAIPLGKCPHSGAERFARGQHYVLESFRLESDRVGYRVGLSVGATIVHDLPKRAAVRYVFAYDVNDMPEVNGSWLKVSIDRDSRQRLYISAVCGGEACTKGPAPARTRKFSGKEWTLPQTCCFGCVTARRRALRAPEKLKATLYQEARVLRLRSEGRCVSCATKRDVDESQHRCGKCRDKANNSRRIGRFEATPVRMELV